MPYWRVQSKQSCGTMVSGRSADVLRTRERYTACDQERTGTVTETAKGMEQQRRYLAYLLRLWQANDDETALPKGEAPGCWRGTEWRASLESPRTGERKGFASLDDLFAFLRRQTGMMFDVDSSDGNQDTPHI